MEASTKRSIKTGDQYDPPALYLTGLKITPLVPAAPDVTTRHFISSPRQTFVAYVEDGPDIAVRDVLTVAGVDYPIRGVGPYPGPLPCLELVVEKVGVG